jgi:NAD(P)-dependent dehydrogenase (short-subunit alcohol dehydrogenase family)
MKVNLEGKVAVVTGSGRGIGRAIALNLAENGADVVVNCYTHVSEGVEVARQIEKIGRKSLFLKADISHSKQVNDMMKHVVKAFSRIDVIVNNAGINVLVEGRVPIQDFSDVDWDRIISVDLKGVFLCSKAAAQQMIKHGGGKIINISSVAGIVPLRLQSAFVAAKAGVINLTRSMALELAPHNINVNAIAPGSILTEGTTTLFYSDPKKAERILSSIPLKRPGTPQEIANAALFLASEDSNYVTGSILVVDGGWTAGYTRDW